MNSKQKIAAGLTALTLALGSNSVIAASARAEPSKGPGIVNLDALKSKNCKAKCDNVDIKTSVKKPSKTKSATKAPSKGVTSDSAKLPNICDNIVYDSYRFGPLVDNAGKTVSKFGPVIKIAENIPEECKSQLSIAASFPSYKARLEFEGFASVYGLENWKNYRYTVGPKNKPIFSNY